MHLLQGVVSTATAWRAYRRPRLAAATLAVSMAESMWFARRCWQRHALTDPAATWVDAAAGVGGLVALRAATVGTDYTTWMNWMAPINLGTVAGAAASLPRREAGVVAATIAATFVASAKDSVSADRGVLATVVVTGLGYLGFVVAGDRFSRHLRASAYEIERARGAAVERGERFAIERERVRQHTLISHSALEMLDVVADGWRAEDDHDVRARARREAARLRNALSSEDDDRPEGLAAALRDVVEDAASAGLSIELLLAELDAEPIGAATVALAEATREALNNVNRHGGTNRAVVRASSEAGHIELTVRDHGAGTDPERLAGYLVGRGGIAVRIVSRLRDVGGTAEFESSPGRGMLVTLRVKQRAS